MDRRNRNYYLVRFNNLSEEMRVRYLKFIDTVKIHYSNKYNGRILVSCNHDFKENVEYELNKAVRNDKFTSYEQI